MRLFVFDKAHHGQKIYLSVVVPTRLALARKWGRNFYLRGIEYEVHEVYAEANSKSTAKGAVIGGLLGALAGPAGILIGSGLGTLFGANVEGNEHQQVQTFNDSVVY